MTLGPQPLGRLFNDTSELGGPQACAVVRSISLDPEVAAVEEELLAQVVGLEEERRGVVALLDLTPGGVDQRRGGQWIGQLAPEDVASERLEAGVEGIE